MELPPPTYTAVNTRVFWDVEDFPIPKDRNLCDFIDKVGHALLNEGYYGEPSVFAFAGSLSIEERCHFMKAEIDLVHEAVEKRTRLNKMLTLMCEWAFLNPPKPYGANFLIVAKDDPEQKSEFFRLLKDLKELGYSFFFAVPDDTPVEKVQLPPNTVSVVWRWTNLFDGKYPIEELDSDYECDEDCEQGTEQAALKRQKITDA